MRDPSRLLVPRRLLLYSSSLFYSPPQRCSQGTGLDKMMKEALFCQAITCTPFAVHACDDVCGPSFAFGVTLLSSLNKLLFPDPMREAWHIFKSYLKSGKSRKLQIT